MKIGIEAQRIFRKEKHGMDIVALELIQQLQVIDKQNEYYIFVKDDVDNQIIEETSNFHIVKIKSASYPYWEQVLLPKEAARYGVDVLHCTSNTAPINTDIPLIITLHDIIYLEKLNLTRGKLYQIFGNMYRRWNVPLAVKKSSCIVTVSEYEKNRITQYFDLPADHVHTIYNGVGENFKNYNQDDIEKIKSKYNLPDNYVFYLGNSDPKKNMIGVMNTLSCLRKAGNLNFQLLMLDVNKDYLTKVAEYIGDTEILKNITICGYVPNNELPAIYSLAKIFLYPSLRESFGIPILEAMACRTPVITSNTSSMPEVAGDAAVFINPNNPYDMGAAILNLLNNTPLQEKLVQRGLKRCMEFSWKKNALGILKLYEGVLKKETVNSYMETELLPSR